MTYICTNTHITSQTDASPIPRDRMAPLASRNFWWPGCALSVASQWLVNDWATTTSINNWQKSLGNLTCWITLTTFGMEITAYILRNNMLFHCQLSKSEGNRQNSMTLTLFVWVKHSSTHFQKHPSAGMRTNPLARTAWGWVLGWGRMWAGNVSYRLFWMIKGIAKFVSRDQMR